MGLVPTLVQERAVYLVRAWVAAVTWLATARARAGSCWPDPCSLLPSPTPQRERADGLYTPATYLVRRGRARGQQQAGQGPLPGC